MKQFLKLAPLAGALALTLSNSASADVPMSDFERDMRMAFENDGEPMDLALLSEQEMRETKGAVWPIFNVLNHWVSRLVTGASFGFIKSGIDEKNNMYSSPIRHWQAANILYWGFAGTISKYAPIGAAIGLWEYGNPNWGTRRIHGALIDLQSQYSNMGAYVRRIGRAIDEHAGLIYGRSSGGAMAYSASQSPSSGVSGSDLARQLPQGTLRTFFAGLPEGKMETYLAGIDPDITRAGFLADLPSETVNKLLLVLPDDDMRDFVGIIPSHIMNPIFNSSPGTAAYWRPHWRT